jgi:hypothetical protein
MKKAAKARRISTEERNAQIVERVTARVRGMSTDPSILIGGCENNLADLLEWAARSIAGPDGDMDVANQDAAFLVGVAVGRVIGGPR